VAQVAAAPWGDLIDAGRCDGQGPLFDRYSASVGLLQVGAEQTGDPSIAAE
jgi:hypothetical protein